MKIACVGNMNNMMFTLCRYLRDRNIDSHLFTFADEAEHFLPEADSYTEDFRNFTVNLPIGKDDLFNSYKIAAVKPLFSGYGFIIGTDVAPALLALLGLKLDVFIPHGSDIYAYPFPVYNDKSTNRIWWLKSAYFIGRIQKKGIRNTQNILFPDEYENNYPYKKKLAHTGPFFNTSGPMLYIPQYHSPDIEQHFKKLKYHDLFVGLRKAYELVVFSHARQNGTNLPENLAVHDKGNLNLIEGFAKFIKESNVNACLVLFEYGMDVGSAKEQVALLGIGSRVKWMPKMQRKEIMFGIRNADIVCGEFKNSWLTCGVVNETLALGKPLLHYRNNVLYKADYPELYPLLNARTSLEISDQLKRFVGDKEKINILAMQGTAWLDTFSVKIPVDLICSFIEGKKNNTLLSFKEHIHISLIKSGFKIRLLVAKLNAKLKR